MNEPVRKANVVGSGLIGGSIGLALRAQGWTVSVSDSNPEVVSRALAMGAGDAAGVDPEASISFVAVPVGSVAEVVAQLLGQTTGTVTDVGSTKLDICTSIDSPRFVGGHPMAGSEQDGLDGSRPQMFEGAMWVLTPTKETDEASFALARSVVKSMGAEAIALHPRTHDQMVAQVSHVPHLTAATLMCMADENAVEHRALLRLAAGGFRDMTRISAGHPSIWPDICFSNRSAIVAGLDQLAASLREVRQLVDDGDTEGLLAVLNRARQARINLPTGFAKADSLVEVAVPIPDRPGEIASISTLAAELDVNIFNLELSHSGEGRRGVMLLVVDAAVSERLVGGLLARSYRPTSRVLD